MKNFLLKHLFWVIIVSLFLWWRLSPKSFMSTLRDAKTFVGIAVDSTADSRQKLKDLKKDTKELIAP